MTDYYNLIRPVIPNPFSNKVNINITSPRELIGKRATTVGFYQRRNDTFIASQQRRYMNCSLIDKKNQFLALYSYTFKYPGNYAAPLDAGKFIGFTVK